MLDLAGGTTVYLSCGATDLRKSYNGLAAIIKLKFHLDPYSRCMFAFCNRRRTSIKLLQWDGSGFWILMKRLDRNAFHWPDTPDELRQMTLKERDSRNYDDRWQDRAFLPMHPYVRDMGSNKGRKSQTQNCPVGTGKSEIKGSIPKFV